MHVRQLRGGLPTSPPRVAAIRTILPLLTGNYDIYLTGNYDIYLTGNSVDFYHDHAHDHVDEDDEYDEGYDLSPSEDEPHRDARSTVKDYLLLLREWLP